MGKKNKNRAIKGKDVIRVTKPKASLRSWSTRPRRGPAMPLDYRPFNQPKQTNEDHPDSNG